MANNTKIDVNKFKDVTMGEIFKKKYPKLIVPMMGLTGPIWDLIREKDAKISGAKK
jgi:hypothetical protein